MFIFRENLVILCYINVIMLYTKLCWYVLVTCTSGWWLMAHCDHFPIKKGNNHPNWHSYFSDELTPPTRNSPSWPGKILHLIFLVPKNHVGSQKVMEQMDLTHFKVLKNMLKDPKMIRWRIGGFHLPTLRGVHAQCRGWPELPNVR